MNETEQQLRDVAMTTPCTFCIDEDTKESCGYVIMGLMLCPDCLGCMQLDEFGNPAPMESANDRYRSHEVATAIRQARDLW